MVLVFTLVIDKTRDLGPGHAAMWIAAMCGAGVVLVIESIVAVRILASMDKSSRPSLVHEHRSVARV